MNRQQAQSLKQTITDQAEQVGIECEWLLETGTLVMKRNGQIKFSFSLRSGIQKEVDDLKSIINKNIPSGKIRVCNMMEAYRPEIRVTVTF